MLRRTRRRLTYCKTCSSKPQSFACLPDDILILISAQCRIDELLALRLTSSRLRNLIDEYMTLVAPSVARSTFPHSDHLLRPTVNSEQYDLLWLKGLIPKQLAAILVDRHRIADEWTQSRYGIPADDAFGDELRARVANGWCVLQRFSNIFKHVSSLRTKDVLSSQPDIASKLLRPSRVKLGALLQREDLILERRLAYLRTLSDQHAKDYKIMLALLSATISTAISNKGSNYEPWIFDWGNGIDGQRSFRKGQTWLTWFVLARGPQMFWEQWWTLPSKSSQNHIRDIALSTFRELPKPLADHQRSLARTFQEAVNKQANIEGDFDGSNPFGYFRAYARCKKQREVEGGLATMVRDTLAHVPFRINFRCPEELVNRAAEMLDAPRPMCRPVGRAMWGSSY